MKRERVMRSKLFLLCSMALLTLSGCQGAFDPFNRPGDWSATGASRRATALQAANQSDLIQGQSEPGSNGVLAVGGIQKATTDGTGTGIQTAIVPTSPASSISGD